MATFILGRAQSGKSTRIYQRAALAERAYIVVPEQFTYETERNILSALGKDVSFFVSALSLKRLSYRLISSAGLSAQVLSDEGSALAVRRSVQLAEPNLTLYRSVAGANGFLNDIKNFIHELKKNSISVETLSAIASGSGSMMYEKLSDVADIYAAYDSLHCEGMLDEAGFFALAAQEAGNSDIIRGAHFFFDGFYSFDRCSYPLISAIIKNAASVSFAMDYCEADDNFAVVNATVRELMELCTECGAAIETEYTDFCDKPPALKLIEEELYSYSDVCFTEYQQNVRLCAADDPASEARGAAELIRSLLRTKKYRYRDIEIVCDIAKYSAALSEAFEALGLRSFADENARIVFSSPVRAFLFLLEISERLSTTDIIAYAKTGFADITDEETMRIENYALQFGIKYDIWEREFTRNDKTESFDLDNINDIRRRLIEPISDFRRRISSAENVSDYCARLREGLISLHFDEKLDILCRRFAEAGDYDAANIYRQINNKLIEIIEQLESFFGSEAIAHGDIAELIRFACSLSSVGVIPPSADRIRICDVLRSRSSSCRVLILLGANEGSLPHEQQEFPILSDEERLKLKNLGAALADSSAYARAKENFLIYTLCARPSEALYVSRTRRDGDEPAEPSPIYTRIAELFAIDEEGIIDFSRPTDSVELMGSPQTAFEKLVEYQNNKSSDKDSSALFGAVEAVLSEYPESRERLAVFREAKNFRNEPEIADKSAYAELLGSPLKASVSMLERYSRCPYSFFAAYILRPTERRTHTVRAVDTGLLLHSAVERFSRMVIAGEVDIEAVTKAELNALAQKIVDEQLLDYEAGLFSQLVKSRYFRSKLTRAAKRAMEEITSQLNRSSFALSETEARFAAGERYTPIYVDLGDGRSVVLSGVIDRIDSCDIGQNGYVRIIDYKSSKNTFDLSELYFALSLQLPIYIRALENAECSAAGVFYFRLMPELVELKRAEDIEKLEAKVREKMKLHGIFLNEIEVVSAMDNSVLDRGESYISGLKCVKGELKMSDSTAYSGEELTHIIDYAIKQVKDISRRVLNAEIPARPVRQSRGNACQYCPYPSVCKFSSAFSGNSWRSVSRMDRESVLSRLREAAKEEQ